MLIQKCTILTSLLFSAIAFPMELTITENYFSPMPSELLLTSIVQDHHKYPWENFKNTRHLGRRVCKQWYNAVADTDSLAQACNIPPMHCAAMMNDATKIIELKLAGRSPCAPDAQKFSPAHYAAACGQHDALTILKIGLAADLTNSHVPCNKDTRKILQDIANSYAPTNSYTIEDLTHAITHNDYTETITILSDDVSLLKNTHRTLMEHANTHGFDDLAKLLLYHLQCALEHTIFYYIAQKKDIPKKFLDGFTLYKANPNAVYYDGATFLHHLVTQKGQEKNLQQLLQLEGININQTLLINGCTISTLQICADTGAINYLQQLLDTKKLNGELFIDHTNISLNQAIKHNHIDYVKLLLEHNTSTINNLASAPCLAKSLNGLAPLHVAVLHGHVTCMHLLINKGANINLTTSNHNTLLHLATEKSDTECLIYLLPLLRHQINNTNDKGQSPLICAISNKYLSYIKLLLDAHADVHIKDIHNQTALHYAATRNYAKIIDLLIQHGADINCTTNSDFMINDENYGLYTPLHCAAYYKHAEALNTLLQHGADQTLLTKTGQTAFELLVTKLVTTGH